jgi:hypothetical protein
MTWDVEEYTKAVEKITSAPFHGFNEPLLPYDAVDRPAPPVSPLDHLAPFQPVSKIVLMTLTFDLQEFRQVTNWMPPLAGEEPEELEEAKDEVEGDEEDDIEGDDEEKPKEDSEGIKSAEPPPPAIEARKTRAQMAKEKEAAE